MRGWVKLTEQEERRLLYRSMRTSDDENSAKTGSLDSITIKSSGMTHKEKLEVKARKISKHLREKTGSIIENFSIHTIACNKHKDFKIEFKKLINQTLQSNQSGYRIICVFQKKCSISFFN